jgi:hypothetical protein
MRAPPLVVTLLLAACGDDPPPNPRGAEDTRGTATGREEQATGAAPLPARSSSRGFEPRPAPAGPQLGAGGPFVRPEGTVTPERDLGAELRGSIGDVRGCLQGFDPGTATTLRIGVRAGVSAQGIVTRAYASGSVPREALACVEARAASVRIPAPVPDGPRSVSTTIEVRFTPAAPREEAPPPPEPQVAGSASQIQNAGDIARAGRGGTIEIQGGGTPIREAPSTGIQQAGGSQAIQEAPSIPVGSD